MDKLLEIKNVSKHFGGGFLSRKPINVAIDDIQTLALPVMRHRMGLNFAAQSEGKKTDDIVRQLLDEIPADEKLYDSKSA